MHQGSQDSQFPAKSHKAQIREVAKEDLGTVRELSIVAQSNRDEVSLQLTCLPPRCQKQQKIATRQECFISKVTCHQLGFQPGTSDSYGYLLDFHPPAGKRSGSSPFLRRCFVSIVDKYGDLRTLPFLQKQIAQDQRVDATRQQSEDLRCLQRFTTT